MKKTAFLALLLVMIPVAYASLEFNPSSLSIELIVGEERSDAVEIKNNHNFSIHELEFSALDGFTFTAPGVIEKNGTGIVNITAEPDYSFDGTLSPIVSFKFQVEVSQELVTVNVTISNNGMEPADIEIREGDTVRWLNTDTISHIISSSDFGEVQIAANTTFERIFNEVKLVNYQDIDLGIGGTINVKSRTATELAQDPNLDQNYNIALVSRFRPTGLEMEIIEGRNMTVQVDRTKEGLLKINNVGNLTAFNVTLSSPSTWIRFDETKFDIEPGETNFVTFEVDPIVIETDETNREYELDINLDGPNVDAITETIEVFVPFHNFANSSANVLSDFFERRRIYCEENPDDALCHTEPIIEFRNQTIIKEPDLPYNFTQSDVAGLFRSVRTLSDGSDRTNNLVVGYQDELTKQLPVIIKLLNQSVNLAQETEEKRQTGTHIRWIVGSAVILILSSIVIGYIMYNWNARKQMQRYYQQPVD